MTEGFKPNSNLYREMSRPHSSSEAFNKATKAFFDGVAELRQKHKIRDVYVIVQSSYLASDGEEELDAIGSLGFGDQFKHDMLLAYSLGVVQTERQELMARVAGHAIKKARER